MPARQDGASSPKQLLDARHLRPRKRFGQNFLVDPRVAQRIAGELPPHSYVIEIGGGTGTLTAALLGRAEFVTTLEIDRDLCEILEDRFASAGGRLRIIRGDVLDFDLAADLRAHPPPRAVAGNLPYYITTPIIELILKASDFWEIAIIMLQQEYARRLTANAGSRTYGSLSVFAAYFVQAEKLFDVGAAGFYPAPAVASTVVRLVPRRHRTNLVRDEELLLWLIRAAFSHRRKTLVNSVLAQLRGGSETLRKQFESALSAAGFDVAVRGERLTLADFCILADTLNVRGLLEHQWTKRSIT
jgi:16S rRNA (adenine1518-N6/adenine1519-N6)-dimethyltransferase